MNTDKESLGIVKTIVRLAQELEKSVVAEGVETECHHQMLKGLSCQLGQGFLFSRPLEAFGAEKLLQTEFPLSINLPPIGLIENTFNLAEEVYAM
jgi:EAL domain-containing protein (putative c-di-GMP-specific phosphodiesterase class I)